MKEDAVERGAEVVGMEDGPRVQVLQGGRVVAGALAAAEICLPLSAHC